MNFSPEQTTATSSNKSRIPFSEYSVVYYNAKTLLATKRNPLLTDDILFPREICKYHLLLWQHPLVLCPI